MEHLKTLYKIINLVFPFTDFFYILQIEEYSSKRLIKWLPRFFFKRNIQKRDSLKFTKRVKVSLLFTLIIWIISYILLCLFLPNLLINFLLALIWIILIPICVLFSNILTSPYFEYKKKKIRSKAVAKVRSLENLKIVVIAGSFGKTTTKNFIYQLVKYNYRTQMIPGNINTPAGIATWVISNLEDSTELLISEVDAYEDGEIAKSCEILKADISVLTNIGDQHLERFKDKQSLANALQEAFTESKGTSILVTTQQVFEFIDKSKILNRSLNIIDLNGNFTYLEKQVSVNNFSNSNLINLKFALKVAEILKIPEKFVQDSLLKLELPDRRQKLTTMYGYNTIDDSYNISFTTAKAGIDTSKEISIKENKKLLVVTGGIPELSKEDKIKNSELGKYLSQKADHTIILNTIFANDIKSGFENNKNYTIYADLVTFLKDSQSKFKVNEWFLLMQPELGDLYY